MPTDLYTRTFDIRYPSTSNVADEERFKEFFNNLFCGRWKMAQYVMQLIILYFTADMQHKSFVIADGSEGNNGKSCLRRCIAAIAPK